MIAQETETTQLLPRVDADQVLKKFKQPDEPLSPFINKIAQRIDGEDRPANLARKGKIYRNHAYYRDQQSGTYSPILDRWIQVEADDELRTINYIRQDVDRVVKQFEQSKTQIRIR